MKPIAFPRASSSEALRDHLERNLSGPSRQGLRAVPAPAQASVEQTYRQFGEGSAMPSIAAPSNISKGSSSERWLAEYSEHRQLANAIPAPNNLPQNFAQSSADPAALVYMGKQLRTSATEGQPTLVVSPGQRWLAEPKRPAALVDILRSTTSPGDQQRLIDHLFAPAPAFLQTLRMLPGLSSDLAALRSAGTSGPQLTKALDDRAATLVRGFAEVGLDRLCWFPEDFEESCNTQPAETNYPLLDGVRAWAHDQLLPWNARSPRPAFHSADWIAFASPWRLVEFVQQAFSVHFASTRAISEEDIGALMGLISRAYVKARKAADPTADSTSIATKLLGAFTERVPGGGSTNEYRYGSRRIGRRMITAPYRENPILSLFFGRVNHPRKWEEERLYDLLGSPMRWPPIGDLLASFTTGDVTRRAGELFDRKVIDPLGQPNLIERRDEFIAIAKSRLKRPTLASWNRHKALRDSFAFALGSDEKPLYQSRL